MGKIIFTIGLCVCSLFSMAQVRLADTASFDSLAILFTSAEAEHLIGFKKNGVKPSTDIAEFIAPKSTKGGLKVFIENAEVDDIIAATVQVMDGERQVAGGVTDFGGFVYIPNIEAGTYIVVIRHIRIGEVKFQVTIRANSIYELREELGVGADCPPPVVIKRNPRAWDYEAMESISKGGLKVFIENAEKDDIIAATVQVMDGERQVAGGVTDFTGFAYIPNIEAGTYIVVIRHINVGEARFEVTIKANSIYELRKELPIGVPLQETPIVTVPILSERAVYKKSLSKGGLKVFIENAELDDIIAATVQVMDGERQVAGGSTDFGGFVYMPNIEAGTYVVVIRHINVGEVRFDVTIQANSIYELKETLEIRDVLISCPCGRSEPMFGDDPFMTSYTTEDILRNPSVMRN